MLPPLAESRCDIIVENEGLVCLDDACRRCDRWHGPATGYDIRSTEGIDASGCLEQGMV